MKLILILLVLAMTGTARAFEPIQFFEEAVKKYEPSATATTIEFTYDPFKYATRLTQYIDRLAQKTNDPYRIAFAFYAIKITQSNGKEQHCVGGIGYRLGQPENIRVVDIEGCNQKFLDATTQFFGDIEIQNSAD